MSNDFITEKELLNKYPEIFRQKDLSMTQTAMCWGIDCDKGWYHIIDTLCSRLQRLTKEGHPQVEFVQVKEKFGGLRVYVHQASDLQYELIDFAEEMSYAICEKCGCPGKLREGMWIVTSCDLCYNKD